MIGNSVLVGGYCEQCVLRLRRLAAARACEVAQASAGAVLAAGVRLRGVHFSYPGGDRPVFDGLDLDLEPGSVTALVGVNGSGKSTLVRLVAGVLFRVQT